MAALEDDMEGEDVDDAAEVPAEAEAAADAATGAAAGGCAYEAHWNLREFLPEAVHKYFDDVVERFVARPWRAVQADAEAAPVRPRLSQGLTQRRAALSAGAQRRLNLARCFGPRDAFGAARGRAVAATCSGRRNPVCVAAAAVCLTCRACSAASRVTPRPSYGILPQPTLARAPRCLVGRVTLCPMQELSLLLIAQWICGHAPRSATDYTPLSLLSVVSVSILSVGKQA